MPNGRLGLPPKWGGPSRSQASISDIAARILILAAFTIIAYLPSFHAPFVFDDVPNLLLNPDVQPESLSDLPDALNARGERDRPIPMLTFAVDYLRGGHDPFPYHATNLAVHLSSAVLVFLVVGLLAQAPFTRERTATFAWEIALAGALLWAVHPVNTQAVTYIVQRMASLAALFYLAGIALFVFWRLGRTRATIALPLILLCYLAALLSKANAVTLPAALLLVDLAFFTRWRRYHTLAAIAALAFGAILAAVYADDAFKHLLTAPEHRDFSGVERMLTQGRVIWHYVSLLVWPAADRLQLDYEFGVSRSLLNPATTLPAWLAILVTAAVAARFIRSATWAAFGWLFFLLAISVESSFLLLELVFEHRLYLPSALLIPGVVAPLYVRVRGSPAWRALPVGVFIVAGLLTWQTIERNTQWADFGGFWVDDLERGASVGRVTINGAVRFLRQGQPERAWQMLQRTDRESAKFLQAKGETLMALGRYDEALDAFRGALEQQPRWSRTAYYAGVSMLESGRVDGARAMLEQIQRLHASSVYALALAANIDQEHGNSERAAERLEEALEARERPLQERIFLRLQLANAYLALDRSAAAQAQYRQVVQANPQQWVAWARLHQLLEAGGSSEQADIIARYMKKHGVEPDDFR